MISWCLPDDRRDALLTWCNMPRAVWESLCIPHRIAVVQMEYAEWAANSNLRFAPVDEERGGHRGETHD